ncbi:MAG: beta strand repeat-containing protein [Planctomycetota bacterium]
MEVTPAAPVIARGTTLQLAATARRTDGTTRPVTALVDWSSSDPAVARFDQPDAPGRVTAVGTGTVTLRAAWLPDGTTGNVTLVVTDAALVSLSLTPAAAATPLGLARSFTATGTFTDGSTQDLTESVTWTAWPTGVATISNATSSRGVATSLAPGSATITATHPGSGIAGTADFTVTTAELVAIGVTPTSPSVPLGLTRAFTATGTYTDGTTQDLTGSVTWSSSATGIAGISNAVGSQGVATTLSLGSTTITATDQATGLAGSTPLTVNSAALVAVAVTPTRPAVPLGLTRAFTATGTYTDGSTQDLTTAVTWTAWPTGFAAVSNAMGSQGLATSLATGSTTITATDPASGLADSTPLTVTAATLVALAVTPTNPSVPLGLTQAFTATGTYSNGTIQDLTTAVTWSSLAMTIAPISNADGSRGVATTLAAGSTTITATDPASGLADSAGLTVTTAQLVSIGVTPTNPSVPLGLTQAFTATGTYTDGTTQDLTGSVTWSSWPAGIAAISNAEGFRGVATSLASGNTTITATHPATGIADSTPLTVSSAVLLSLAVTPTNPSVPLGVTQTFTATGTYTDGTTQDLTGSVTWSSWAAGIAGMSNAAADRGIASTLAPGATTITATDPASGIAGSTAFTVTTAQLVSLAVTPSNPSVPLGLTRAFTATGTYTDGTTQDLTSAVMWSSFITAVASISNADGSRGLATTLANGSTTITATDPTTSIAGGTGLTVTAAQLASLAVTPSNSTVPLGLTRVFTATGTYTDGTTQDLTTSVTWSSSSTAVATISNAEGSQVVGTTLATGSTIITATHPATGIAGSTALTVTGAALVSIAVAPANPTIVTGQTQAFTAVGTYTDGTTQNVTATVTWSSYAIAIAAISNAAGTRGLATALSAGTTTITAADPASGITATTSLSAVQWSPLAIAPALWLDAADPATIILATGVSEWRDKSGNGRHFTQPTPASQPAYSASSFFGQPGLTFDGTNDIMNLTGINPIIANQTHGVYWVFRRLGNGVGNDAYRPVIGLRHVNGTSDIGALHYVKNGNLLGASYPYFFTPGTFAYDLSSGNAYGNAEGHVMAFQANATSAATGWQVHRNGTLEGTTSGIAAPNASVDGYTLGAQINPLRYSNVIVAEVLLVVNTDQATRQRIEGYLAWKWGLTANLPAGHPFKSAPP